MTAKQATGPSAKGRGCVKTCGPTRAEGGDERRSASVSGPDRFHQRLGSEHRHYPVHVVGQIILGHIVVETLGKQRLLPVIGPLNEAAYTHFPLTTGG